LNTKIEYAFKDRNKIEILMPSGRKGKQNFQQEKVSIFVTNLLP